MPNLIESITLDHSSTTPETANMHGALRLTRLLDETTDSHILQFERQGSQPISVPIPKGYESVAWGIYILALHAIDLARINLGSNVIVNDQHSVEQAVTALLNCMDGVNSSRATQDDPSDSIDVFIGCSARDLVSALPSMRQKGLAVIPCPVSDHQRLDIYSTLHRKGLSLVASDLAGGNADLLSETSGRLNRMMIRYGGLDEAYHEHSTRLRGDPSTAWQSASIVAEKP